MKTVYTTLFVFFFALSGLAQNSTSLTGAYLAKDGNTNRLWLFVNGYSSHIEYESERYVSTWGGPFKLSNKSLSIQLEYNDATPEEVGKTKSMTIEVTKNKIIKDKLVYIKQDLGKQELDGLWRITARKNEDKMTSIARGDRKTIKILVDGFFQWVAINPAEKGFYGTGGGHYIFKNKKYTEHILFFSRDNSRIGAHLEFTGETKDGNWHHSGMSSKGNPIYEIWSLEKNN